ncbi:hypothetical protein AAVH_42126 [Aphelenchoides avenae]|nr:hypothetical protein AAVH_42126 [Aphelenchus avenae]
MTDPFTAAASAEARFVKVKTTGEGFFKFICFEVCESLHIHDTLQWSSRELFDLLEDGNVRELSLEVHRRAECEKADSFVNELVKSFPNETRPLSYQLRIVSRMSNILEGDQTIGNRWTYERLQIEVRRVCRRAGLQSVNLTEIVIRREEFSFVHMAFRPIARTF